MLLLYGRVLVLFVLLEPNNKKFVGLSVHVGYSVENVKIQNVNIYLFVRKCKQSVIYMSFLPIKLLNENMVFIPLPNLTGSNCIAIKL